MFKTKLKAFWFIFKSLFFTLPNDISYSYIKSAPEYLYPKILKKIFKKNCGYNLNLFFPKTFNEKINYLKLFDNIPEKTTLTDKIAVIDFVKDKINEKHIKKILGVYNSFDEIDLDGLPDSFFLKTNHGCKMQKLIESKEYFIKHKEELRAEFNKFLDINFAYFGLELQYKDIKPKIFAEEVVKHSKNMLPIDLEIFCFNGKPKLTLIREIEKEENFGLNIYSTEEGLLPYTFNGLNENFRKIKYVSLPKNYEEMLIISKKLSKGFKFVRVDFLCTDNNFYFAEMTFTPYSGFCEMPDKNFDKMVSKYFKL